MRLTKPQKKLLTEWIGSARSTYNKVSQGRTKRKFSAAPEPAVCPPVAGAILRQRSSRPAQSQRVQPRESQEERESQVEAGLQEANASDGLIHWNTGQNIKRVEVLDRPETHKHHEDGRSDGCAKRKWTELRSL